MPFILDKPTAKEPTFIFYKSPMPDGPFKYSTRQKVLPKDWNQETQRTTVKGKESENNKAINSLLTRFENVIRDYLREVKRDGIDFSRERLIEKLDVITQRKSVFKKKSFFEHCTDIISDMETGAITIRKGSRAGKRYSKGTIKNYRQTLDVLQDFETLRFETVAMDTYYRLIRYGNEHDFSLNYTGQHIKNLKCLLEEGYRRGLHQNKIFENKDFRTLSEKTDDIYFTENELGEIVDLKLTGIKELARDWFVLDCYLGLRVCDLKILNDKHLQKDRIMIVNEKTDTKVVLPIHPRARHILAKYKGLPRPISEQKINLHIKEVAKMAGLTGAFIYTLTKGGTRKDHYLEKWEMASNHTARRSFISNLLTAGVEFSKVMLLAGISKPETLMRYMKVTPEQNADDVAKHKFFMKAV